MSCCGGSKQAQKPGGSLTAQSSVNMNGLPSDPVDQARTFQSANSKSSDKPKRTRV